MLVDNDTTSGHINSRIIYLQTWNISDNKEKSAEFTPRRLIGVSKQKYKS
jgi:hypothetical protein